jgi:hypothetical protein
MAADLVGESKRPIEGGKCSSLELCHGFNLPASRNLIPQNEHRINPPQKAPQIAGDFAGSFDFGCHSEFGSTGITVAVAATESCSTYPLASA